MIGFRHPMRFPLALSLGVHIAALGGWAMLQDASPDQTAPAGREPARLSVVAPAQHSASATPTDSSVVEPRSPLPELPSEAPAPAQSTPEPEAESEPEPEPELELTEQPAPTPLEPSAGEGVSGKAEEADWKAELQAHLAQYRRYPRRALLRALEGDVRLALDIDAAGRILDHRLASPSRHDLLNEAVHEMVSRANPVPAPPASALAGGRLRITVPVRFTINE
ncbi:MAG: energy transducer TonB [Spiribacter salinus]|uniref:Energy transducer TonB n=1 Tax=Spiribacter salinus TaxID=1335746 RepID=A0A540VV05_9GAMM|nr:MAG: energy transducer TonB [Spiribacter salinus]